MKTATRWAAIMLTAVFLLTSGLFALTAAAQGSTESGEGSLTDTYERWSEGASTEHVAAMDSIDADTLSGITDIVGQLGDTIFLEAIYRKANMIQKGFSAEEEQCLAKLNKLSIQQLGALYSYWRFVMGELRKITGETDSSDETAGQIPGDVLEALSGSLSVVEPGATVDTIPPDTQAAQGEAQGSQKDAQSGEGSLTDTYERWSEGASTEHVAAMDSIDADTLSGITDIVGQLGDTIFLEAIYRKANVIQEGFSAEEEQCLAKLNKLSIQQLGALYSYWRFVMGELRKITGETDSAAETATPAPAVPPEGPLTDEKTKEVGDYLMSKIGQGSEQEQQNLGAWFMSLSVENQNTVIDHLKNTQDAAEFEKFWAWMKEVLMSSCSENSSPPDTLNLRGGDWGELTIPGLPAPAQGKVQQKSIVSNNRVGRQVVLGQVTQETFDAWLAQIPQGGALTEQADADGKAFDNNFGPTFSSKLQDSGGKAATVYFRDAAGTDVRVDYLYTDQTLSVAVLEP